MARRGTPRAAEERARHRIGAALSECGFALPGSLNIRTYRCGKPNCACHTSEDRMHGPYIQWTRSVEGKTVHRRLSQEELEEFQPYFDEAKRLKELIATLEEVTMGIVERGARRETA